MESPIKKPDLCRGCVGWGDGTGFVPDEIVPGAEVFVLMQNPGGEEEACGKPAVGSTGRQMNTEFLPLAGLERGRDVSVGNVVKCRWGTWTDMTVGGQTVTRYVTSNAPPPEPELGQMIHHCVSTHLQIPESVKLIIAQGGWSYRAVTGGLLRRPDGKPMTVTDWRGHMLPTPFQGRPVYQVLHIAGLDRQAPKKGRQGGMPPLMRRVARWDWGKVPLILQGLFPQSLPPSLVASSENEADVAAWFNEANEAASVVIDTEYNSDTKSLTLLGLLARFPDGRTSAFQIAWWENGPSMRALVTHCVRYLVRTVPCLMHNFQADVPVIQQNLGIHWSEWLQIDDTLQKHAVIWSEFPHTAEFLGSLYGRHERTKHLSVSDPFTYNLGDLAICDDIDRGVEREFAYDPQARQVYETQQQPMIPIWLRCMEHGIRVHPERVLQHYQELQTTVERVNRMVRAMYGRPFNINSDDQMKDYCYRQMGYPEQYDKDTGQLTTDEDAIHTLRRHIGPPFSPDEPLTFERILQRIDEGADPILELRILGGKAGHNLSNYIRPLIRPDGTVVDRIHPSIGMPQKTGRWAMTGPPISVSTLPDELFHILIPDAGCVWMVHDWKAIELWFLRYLSNSRVLAEGLEKGYDLPTMTVCILLKWDLPPNLVNPHTAPENAAWRAKYHWKGKHDPRRTWGKSARFEMNYGGGGGNAAQAAALHGLNPVELKAATQNMIAADPEYAAWRRSIEAEVRTTRMTRTFLGRPWIHLGSGHEIIREGLDHKMQGGVVDVAHTTAVEIAKRLPDLWLAWAIHDSQAWACPHDQFTPDLYEEQKAIITRPFQLGGREVRFPADFSLIYSPELEEQYATHTRV